jgi:hypothetical protein
MVGIADIPVEIISGLKTSIHESALERAEKSRAASTTSLSSTANLPLSKHSTSESVIPNSTEAASVYTQSSNKSEDGVIIKEKEVESSVLSVDKRTHTISVHDLPVPKLTHRFDLGADFSHNATVRAEKSATNAAIVVMRPAMDFTLSIARGFHNVPKLYGDDTIRSPDKVTDFKSGVATAGKEFTYGWYDGISGLLTQPYNGAKKNGVRGFLEGIGKGVGGFILKPGSGNCTLHPSTVLANASSNLWSGRIHIQRC